MKCMARDANPKDLSDLLENHSLDVLAKIPLLMTEVQLCLPIKDEKVESYIKVSVFPGNENLVPKSAEFDLNGEKLTVYFKASPDYQNYKLY